MLEGLALAGFLAAYFGIPYIFLRRGAVAQAGLAMLAVAILGLVVLRFSSSALGASALVFLLLPLPVIFILVGLVARTGKSGGSGTK